MKVKCIIKNPFKRFLYYLLHYKDFKLIRKFLKENQDDIFKKIRKNYFDMLNNN
jgi:mRNA-degrading endonuclease RelE of RelBE toxin-antitoxin system